MIIYFFISHSFDASGSLCFEIAGIFTYILGRFPPLCAMKPILRVSFNYVPVLPRATLIDFTTAVVRCHVSAIKGLPVLHYTAVCICFSLGLLSPF